MSVTLEQAETALRAYVRLMTPHGYGHIREIQDGKAEVELVDDFDGPRPWFWLAELSIPVGTILRASRRDAMPIELCRGPWAHDAHPWDGGGVWSICPGRGDRPEPVLPF